MIEVKGPNVFKGYWRNPEKTRAELHEDGYFTTGDLGYRDARGYVFLVGRDKDLIITGGLNVYPAEVERVLDRLPGVVESAVIGVPDAEWGEAVVAVIRRQAGASAAASTELEAGCRQSLAGYKVPRRFEFVDDYPRTVSGKVLKRVLRETYAAR
jgi:malonyl-CoA/methylmalonyl-CoA synthetase